MFCRYTICNIYNIVYKWKIHLVNYSIKSFAKGQFEYKIYIAKIMLL